MDFKKKDLEFLKVYQSCVDTNSFNGDKLNIIFDKEKSKVYFTLFTDDVKFIKEIHSKIDENFVMSINLVQFNQMASFCKDDDIIDITRGKIKFGNNSEYNFETYDFNMEDFNYILNMELDGDILNITDLLKIDKISFSIGLEDSARNRSNLACIAYQDGYFVTYNGSVCSFIKTENKINENFYLPKMFYKLYQIYKFKEISLKVISDNFLFMNVNDMKIYLARFDYGIPYIFGEDLKKKYEHENHILIDKDNFKTAISRLKVLGQKTNLHRVFIYFNDILKIEIKDEYCGFESVTSEYIDENIKNSYVICNILLLHDILNNYKENFIKIKTSLDGNSPLKIEDEKNKVCYLLVVREKRDSHKTNSECVDEIEEEEGDNS